MKTQRCRCMSGIPHPKGWHSTPGWYIDYLFEDFERRINHIDGSERTECRPLIDCLPASHAVQCSEKYRRPVVRDQRKRFFRKETYDCARIRN